MSTFSVQRWKLKIRGETTCPRPHRQQQAGFPRKFILVAGEACALIHDTARGPCARSRLRTIRSDEQVPFLPVPASCSSLRASRHFSGLAGFLLASGWVSAAPAPPAGRAYYCFVPSHALSLPSLGDCRAGALWLSWTTPCESKKSQDRVSLLPGLVLQVGPSNYCPWTSEFLFSPCLTKLLLLSLRPVLQKSSGQKVQHWPECPQGH